MEDGRLAGESVVWVGRSPPWQYGFRQAGSLQQALALRPEPELFVIDPVDPAERQLWLETAQPALEPLSLVLVVAENTPEVLAAAARAGVLCCLPRCSDPGSRTAVLTAALQLHRRRKALSGPERFARTGGARLLEATWVLRTPEEAEVLASLLAECCPRPDRRVGGLIELLINAIEHGNLEISGPGKRALLADGRWYDELMLRLADPRYSQRTVRVSFERKADGEIVLSIEDDGAGFDFAEVLERELTQNDTRHGRGIALARLMSFDHLSWEGRGNRVVGRILP
jgi:hypothetical protein